MTDFKMGKLSKNTRNNYPISGDTRKHKSNFVCYYSFKNLHSLMPIGFEICGWDTAP